jgi:hypothetical protein
MEVSLVIDTGNSPEIQQLSVGHELTVTYNPPFTRINLRKGSKIIFSPYLESDPDVRLLLVTKWHVCMF